MQQTPSWEANRVSASQEIPTFYGTRRFITAVTCPRLLSLSRVTAQVRDLFFDYFATWYVITVRNCSHLAKPPNWRTTPCRLSANVYAIYSQLPSILEAVPPSSTWGCAMPWWRTHGLLVLNILKAVVCAVFICWKHCIFSPWPFLLLPCMLKVSACTFFVCRHVEIFSLSCIRFAEHAKFPRLEPPAFGF